MANALCQGKDSNGKVAPMGATTDPSGAPAVNAVVANLDLYTPSRDIFVDWLHGTADAVVRLTASTAAPGLPGDLSELNPDARSIVIYNVDGGADYAYTVGLSRTGLLAQQYIILTEAEAVQDQWIQIPLTPAAYGYDQYVHVTITPAAGQTGTELDFQVYLTGRGG